MPITSLTYRISAGIALILSIAGPAPSTAENVRWQAYKNAGEAAFSNHKYKKAEHYWARAVHEATRSDVGDADLAVSQKRLAECNIANKKYQEAEINLQRSIKTNKALGLEDPEALSDLLELAKTYHSVNLDQFGKTIATIFRQAGLNKIEILKTADGNKVQIEFADNLKKHIDSQSVDKINIDKKVTFEVIDDGDGTITLTNIKGLKVRSKVWANLTESSFQLDSDPSKATAQVTAKKMGVKKTVTTVLPKPLYDSIVGLVERIKHPELHSPTYKAIVEKLSHYYASPHKPKSEPATTEARSAGEHKPDSAPPPPTAQSAGEHKPDSAPPPPTAQSAGERLPESATSVPTAQPETEHRLESAPAEPAIPQKW